MSARLPTRACESSSSLKPRVLHLERREPLQTELGIQPLALELLVLRNERFARRQFVRADAQPLNGRSTSRRTG